ncbi:MAG: hypothetical protein JXB10_14165 [Pirellulales bacterium]|nr:hypothetical protein [Pirellulales bacterium]
MSFDRLLMLLPCQGIENLKLDRPASEAEQLLGGWSALWHPALIHRCRKTPQWAPAPLAPRDLDRDLIVLPDCAKALLPEDFWYHVPTTTAVLQGFCDGAELLPAVLQRLDPSAGGVDPELTADFLALGYCHMVVELLTRQHRSMSNLDAAAFCNAVTAAADAAVQGDGTAARENLQTAFDRLHDAREYFFPFETKLLDLTLTAPTTLGEPFRRELQTDVPHNLLLGGEVIERLAAEEPESLALLRERLEQNRAALLGGEYAETRLPLLPPEAITEQLLRGRETYRRHGIEPPNVFARRRFGLTLALPQILEKHGLTAALHFTLDDGQFPAGRQSRIQWQGFDDAAIESVTTIPLDAGRPESFLRFPDLLGKTLERDHAPTVIFAHWPGGASPWYDVLRRIAGYSSVLGEFQSLSEYFDQTEMAGQRVQYRPDQYRSPYLIQDVEAGLSDPLLHSVAFLRCWIEEKYRTMFHAWEQILMGQPTAESDAGRLASALGAQLAATNSSPEGYLLLNPWSFSHRCGVSFTGLNAAPEVNDSVRVTDAESAVVDLPGSGFVWLGSNNRFAAADTAAPATRKKKAEPPLAEKYLLRNEFFELHFDPHTGALRALNDYQGRHPRLAQQLALRIPQNSVAESGSDRHYTIMALDEMHVISPGPVFGELLCRGRLMDRDGRLAAEYDQTTRVWRGNRVIELEIDLKPHRLPDGPPWDSYYACRFAWSDETCTLTRSVNWANRPTEAERLEAPLMIDVHNDRQHTTLLTAGLPYHRRLGLRRLDTLLIVRGEMARQFRLGIGIDLPNPTAAALAFLAPPVAIPCAAPPPRLSGWLFHLDRRNVVATHWEPLWEEEGSGVRGQRSGISNPQSPIPNPSSLLSGFRVRLLETEGRPAQLGLRCFRPLASAWKLETGDAPPSHLNVEGDRITVPIGPHQWFDLEARFQ